MRENDVIDIDLEVFRLKTAFENSETESVVYLRKNETGTTYVASGLSTTILESVYDVLCGMSEIMPDVLESALDLFYTTHEYCAECNSWHLLNDVKYTDDTHFVCPACGALNEIPDELQSA